VLPPPTVFKSVGDAISFLLQVAAVGFVDTRPTAANGCRLKLMHANDLDTVRAIGLLSTAAGLSSCIDLDTVGSVCLALNKLSISARCDAMAVREGSWPGFLWLWRRSNHAKALFLGHPFDARSIARADNYVAPLRDFEMTELPRPVPRSVVVLANCITILSETPASLIVEYDPGFSLLIHPSSGFGEAEWAQRLFRATQNLGWVCSSNKSLEEQNSLESIKTFDFAVCMRDPVSVVGVPSFLAVSDMTEEWLTRWAEAIRRFRGILCASAPPMKLLASHAPMPPVERWVPSCEPTAFEPTRTAPGRVFYCGSQWDARRSSSKFMRLLAGLAGMKRLDVFGPREAWINKSTDQAIQEAWRGFLPQDGAAVVAKIHECGIALVLHSEGHLRSGAPCSRIFEAGAASAVIISDKHPFVMRHFGSSVLYLDDRQEPLDSARTHLQWIDANPELAQRIAFKAHHAANPWNLYHQLDALANLSQRIKSKAPPHTG
jgi:hypothetical protein